MKRVEQVVIALFALVGVICLIQAVNAWCAANNWDLLKASDWASWVQAFGSIAAIVYAVKIANGERESQKAEKTVFAILQGQLIKHELEEFLRMARHHGENLSFDEVRAVPGTLLLSWLSRQRMWTVEEISLLAALPGGIAIDFAKGQAAIRAAIVEMEYARDPSMPWSEGQSSADARTKHEKNSVELYWTGLRLLESVKGKLPDALPGLHSQRQ